MLWLPLACIVLQSRTSIESNEMDRLTKSRRSENMRRIQSKDTLPELAVRRIAHAMGFRFRLHRKDLPGKPDLVFPGLRKVIFVHGCFWHQHSRCPEGRLPKMRLNYWAPKLARNRERDRENLGALEKLGWDSLTIWECEIKDAQTIRNRIAKFLGHDH